MSKGLNYARAAGRDAALAARREDRQEKRQAEAKLYSPYRHGMPSRVVFEITGTDGLRLGIVGWDDRKLYAARYSRATKAWTTSMEPWQTLRLLEEFFKGDGDGKSGTVGARDEAELGAVAQTSA